MISGLFILFIILLPITLWSVSTVVGLVRAKGVPYVPLSKFQLGLIQKSIKLKENDSVVDLGCGDGRVLRLFEKQGVKRLAGYEINFWAYLKSQIIAFLVKSKAKIFYKNFNQVSLEKYDVVFCYLLERCMSRLRKKFDQELKPGTTVISFAFPIKDWRESKIIYTNEHNKNLNRIFIYHI